MLIIEFRMLVSFEHVVQSLLNTHLFLVFVLGCTLGHIPLQCLCPIKITNKIRQVNHKGATDLSMYPSKNMTAYRFVGS